MSTRRLRVSRRYPRPPDRAGCTRFGQYAPRGGTERLRSASQGRRCSRGAPIVAAGSVYMWQTRTQQGRIRCVRWPPLLCSAVAVAGFTASCGDRHDELTCEVMLGETRTTASLVTRVGESIDATLNPYVVTFSVLPKSRLRAEVSSAGNAQPLMSSETGLRGGAGAMATGEGELTFGCA
jgi:hypothetical protein